MPDLQTWLMVFLRISGLLAIFPIFSARNFPVQLRLGLGILVALLVTPSVPPSGINGLDLWALVGGMMMEVGIGLFLGFTSRIIFYALELAGNIISNEIGLSLPPSMNPFSEGQTTAIGTMLYYLAAVIWLCLDSHHWLLLAFHKSYLTLPIGGAHLMEASLVDAVQRTGQVFLIALQMSAPIIAVAFLVNLVFAVLGRAVPQMNVFTESFAIRTLSGMIVLGLSLQIIGEHLSNHLRRLPTDLLRVTQLLSGG